MCVFVCVYILYICNTWVYVFDTSMCVAVGIGVPQHVCGGQKTIFNVSP